MAKSYEQIQKQIAALQKEAEAMRSKQVQSVIREIKEAIATYGLSAEDLGLAVKAKGRKKATNPASTAESTAAAPVKKATRAAKKSANRAAKKAKQTSSSGPKFSDDSGNVWSGRGPRPKWLKDALSQGRTLEEFSV